MNSRNVMGLIFCNEQDELLKELTSQRAIGSVPFGARYRLVDFALSGLVNSGITKVGLLTKQNYRSLAGHVGSGRHWDLSRKTGGLVILSPYVYPGTKLYKGRIDALYGAMDYIASSKEEYVVISNANIVTSFSIEDMVDSHLESGADITVAYAKGEQADSYIDIEDGRVVAFKREQELSKDSDRNALMETFVIKREFLINLVNEAAQHNYTNFTADIFKRLVKDINIRGYAVSAYVRPINSMKTYFDANMDLLSADIRRELFANNGPVFTKTRDTMPAKYGFESNVENSLIAVGCVIEGSVKNSVIFRDVKVKKGARVENCIIMQSSQIGENAQLDYCVADKNVVISPGRELMGCASFPLVISKNKQV